jgi:PAS domain S-box-containing protein
VTACGTARARLDADDGPGPAGRGSMTGSSRRSDRDRAPQGALHLSEERFRLLVEGVVDYAIYLLDPGGRVASWNTGAQRLKGYAEEEILGQHYSVFYTDETRASGLPARLLDEARTHGRVEHTGWRVRRDGTRFWADAIITALHDERGQLAGFAKVTRDMTATHLAEESREQALVEKERAVERLEELDRWRRNFLNSVIHDLQNPLIAIVGFASLLRDGRTPEGLHERDLAERVLSNARSVQDLIDNLRAYGRLTEDRVALHREPIELGTYLRTLRADLTPVLGDHRVEVEADGVTVVADRLGLERILRNLLVNAVRHTPPGTQIRVRAAEVDGAAVIEVEDDGEGIPASLLPHIFDRFESGHDGGTGLGLSIVRSYVELHGGEISVDSTAGEGTTFRILLPRPASTAGEPDRRAR